MSTNIKVAIRVRPFLQREKDEMPSPKWTIKENSIRDSNNKTYHFDKVMDSSTDNEGVYLEVSDALVESVMEGFNGTVFAYGQTASGKTFTMMGSDEEPGMVRLAIQQIFSCIEKSEERQFLIRVSFMEIYNETIRDLLDDKKKHVDVRENYEGMVYVHNLEEKLVKSPQEILTLMRKGEAARHVGQTNMNERSSRSHTIFRMVIESAECKNPDGAVWVSHLNLVDLAGSEKAKSTGATGQRLVEGGFINKSLFMLGNVISQLSDKQQFVSYRDSKLTRILSNSLGGNSKTCIVACVSPASLEETHSTLRFATSAKRIQNKPSVNAVMSEAAMLQQYQIQLKKLEKEIQAMKSSDVREEMEELQQQLQEKELLQAEQEKKLKNLQEFIISSTAGNSEENPKMKKKRRETWCPGKARSANLMPPPLLPAVPSPWRRSIERMDMSNVSGRERHRSYGRMAPAFPSLGEVDESRESTLNSSTFSIPSHEATMDLLDNFLIEKSVQTELSTEEKGMVTCEQDEVELLRAELSDAKKQNAELEEMMSAITDMHSFSTQQSKNLEDEIAALKRSEGEGEHTKGNNSTLNVRSESLEKLQARIAELEEETKENWKTKFDELDTKHTSLMAEHAELKQNYNEMSEMPKSMMEQLEQTVSQKDRLQEEYTGLNVKYEELHQLFKQTEAELSELQEFTRFERDMKNESIMEKEEIKRELSTLRSEHADSDVVLEMERKKYARRESELEQQLEMAYKELETKSDGKRRSFAPVENLASIEMAQLREQIAQFEEKIAQHSSETEKLLARITELESEGLEKSAEVPSGGEVEEMVVQLREQSVEVDELKKKILALESENADLLDLQEMQHFTSQSQHIANVSVTDLSELAAELRTEIDSVKQEKAKLEEDLARVNAEKAEIEKDLQESVESSIDAQDELRELQIKFQELKEEKKQWKSQPQPKEDSGSTTVKEVSEYAQQTEDVEVSVELEMLRSELDAAKQECQSLREQSSETTCQNSESQTEKSEFMTTCEVEIQTESDEALESTNVAALQQELRGLITEKEALKQQLAEVQQEGGNQVMPEELAAMQEQLDIFQGEKNALVEKLEVSDVERQRALGEVDEVKLELSTVQDQLDFLEQENKSLQDKVTSMREMTRKSTVSADEFEKLQFDFEQSQSDLEAAYLKIGDLEAALEETQGKETNETPVVEELRESLHKTRMELEEFKKLHEVLESQCHTNKGRLLSETNRDLDQQKRIETLEEKHKETISTFSRTIKENQEIIDGLNKQVCELGCQLQKAKTDAEMAGHRLKKVEEEKEAIKSEMRTLEDLQATHEANSHRQDMNPEKMQHRIKTLMVSLDLTNQRCSNYEVKVKQLEVAARKAEDAIFERNNLQGALRDTQHTLQQKTDELGRVQQLVGSSQSELAQLRLQVHTLQDKLSTAKAEVERATMGSQKFDDVKHTLEQQKKELANDLQKLAAEKRTLGKQIEKLNEKVSELESQLSGSCSVDELDKLRHEHESALKTCQVEYENHKSELMATFEDQIKEAKETAEEELLEKIEAIRDQAMTHLEKEREDLVKAHEDEKESIKSELQSRLTSVENDHTEQISSLKTEHRAELDRVIAEHEERITELSSRLKQLELDAENRESVLEKRGSEVEEIESKSREETAILITQRQEAEAEHKQVIEKLKEEHHSQIESLESCHRTTIERLETELREAASKQASLISGQASHEELVQHFEMELQLAATQHAESLAARDEKLNLVNEQLTSSNEELESVRVMLTAEREKIESMEQQIAEIDEQNTELQKKVSELEDKRTELESLGESQSTELERLAGEVHQWKQQLEEMRAELEQKEVQLRARDDGESSELQQLLSQLTQLKAELTSKTEALATKESELETHQIETGKALSRAQSLQEEVQMLSEENLKRAEEMLTLEEQHDSLKKTLACMSEDHHNTVTALEENCATLQVRIGEMERHHVTLSDEVTAKEQEEKAQLQERLQAAEDAKLLMESSLQTQMESHQEELEALNQCLKDASDELREEQRKLSTAESKIGELQEQYEAVQKEKEALQTLRDSTSAQIDQSGTQLQQLQAQIDQLQADLQFVQGEVAVKDEEVEQWRECCMEANSEKSELSKTVAELEKQLADSGSAKPTDSLGDIEELKAEIERKTKEVDYHKSQYDLIVADTDEMDAENEQMRVELSKKDKTISQLNAELKKKGNGTPAASGKEIEEVKAELEKKQKEAEYHKTLYDRLVADTDEMDAENEQMRVELSKKDKTISQLNGELKKKGNSMSAASGKEIEEMKAELEKKQKEVEYHKKLYDRLVADTDEMEKENEQYQAKLYENEKLIRQLRGNKKEHKPADDDIEAEKKRLEQLCADQEIQLSVLRQDMLAQSYPLNKQIEELRSLNDDKREKLWEAKQELRRLRNQANTTVSCPKCAAGSQREEGQDMDAQLILLENMKIVLEKENKKLKEHNEKRQKEYEDLRSRERRLTKHVRDQEKQFHKLKSSYIRTDLSDTERQALKELENSVLVPFEQQVENAGPTLVQGMNPLDDMPDGCKHQ